MTKTTSRPPIYALPPTGSKCQEAASDSREDYIPCGKPASYIIKHGGNEAERAGYFMCLECATHNVRNRGGRYVVTGERYLPVTVSDHRDARNAQTEEEQLADDIEAAPDASDAELRRCSELAQQQKQLVEEIARLEDRLGKLKLALKTNMEADLPEAMSKAGQEEFTILGGHKVKLEKKVRASIPEAFETEGLKYMMKHAPDIVKHIVTIEFDRKEDKFFKKFIRDLKQRKAQVNMSVVDRVHPQTLGKWVREQDEANKPVPEEILGVYRQNTAKVHLPKMGKEDI